MSELMQPDNPLRGLGGLGICPCCDERGKRIPNADWPNQESHQNKPHGDDDIVMECPSGHKWLIAAETPR